MNLKDINNAQTLLINTLADLNKRATVTLREYVESCWDAVEEGEEWSLIKDRCAGDDFIERMVKKGAIEEGSKRVYRQRLTQALWVRIIEGKNLKTFGALYAAYQSDSKSGGGKKVPQYVKDFYKLMVKEAWTKKQIEAAIKAAHEVAA